jgi:hypothetical protein
MSKTGCDVFAFYSAKRKHPASAALIGNQVWGCIVHFFGASSVAQSLRAQAQSAASMSPASNPAHVRVEFVACIPLSRASAPSHMKDSS